MPESFYEGDLHVLEVEKRLREEAHKKLDKLDVSLDEIKQKVKDARERLPIRNERNVSSDSSDRGSP